MLRATGYFLVHVDNLLTKHARIGVITFLAPCGSNQRLDNVRNRLYKRSRFFVSPSVFHELQCTHVKRSYCKVTTGLDCYHTRLEKGLHNRSQV